MDNTDIYNIDIIDQIYGHRYSTREGGIATWGSEQHMHGDWGASTRLAIQAGSCMITPRVCLLVESVSLPLHYRNTGTGLSQEYSVMGPTPVHSIN